MSNIYAIPGFMSPRTPNLDAKVAALPTGKLVWNVMPAASETSLPNLHVVMSREYGAEITRTLVDSAQITLLNVAAPSGKRWIQMRIETSQVDIEPGTYVMSVLQGDEEVARKWVSITPHSQRQVDSGRTDYPAVLQTDSAVAGEGVDSGIDFWEILDTPSAITFTVS